MAWLSRSTFTPQDNVHSDDLNNLALDIRNWGGNVNGGGYSLFNVYLPGVLSDPSTTVGDLLVHGPGTGGPTALERLPVGTDGLALVADHTQRLGVKWGAVAGGLVDPTTTKGDIIAKPNAAPPTRVPVGLNGQVLMADSAQLTGLKWGTITGVNAPGPDKSVIINQNGPFGYDPAFTYDYTNHILNVNGSITVNAVAVVAQTRRVNTNATMTGGGPLSADLTLGVVHAAGDYTAAQVTNAVDSTQSYNNPGWITGLAASKITPGVVTAISPGNLSGGVTLAVSSGLTLGQAGQVITFGNSGVLSISPGTLAGAVTLAGANGVTVTQAGQTITIGIPGGAPLGDPTTTKGDLIVRGSASPPTRLGVGTDGMFLVADSSQTLGIKWMSTSLATAQSPWATNINANLFNLNNLSTLGIGLTTPAYLVDVRGTNNPQIHLSPDATDTGGYLTAPDQSSLMVAGGAAYVSGSWIAKASAASLIAMTNSAITLSTNFGMTVGNAFTPSPRIAIAANGNVGISYASPNCMLDIRNGGGIQHIHTSYDATDTGFYAYGMSTTGGSIGGNTAPGNGAWQAKATAGAGITMGASGVQLFADAGLTTGNTYTATERMRINTAGRVLIGSPLPTDDGASMLQTNGNQLAASNSGQAWQMAQGFSASGTSFGGQFRGYAARGTQAAPSATQAGDWVSGLYAWQWDGAAWQGSGRIVLFAQNNATANNVSGYMSFAVNPGGASASQTEAMRITSVGNIGIGNDGSLLSAYSNAVNLLIGSSATLWGQIIIGGSQGGTNGLIGSMSFFNFAVAAADKRVAAINGVTDTATNSGQLVFFTWNAGAVGERMRINGVGNVGIGTASPSYNLHVVTAATSYTQLGVTNATGTSDTGIIIQDANRGWKIGINVAATSPGSLCIYDITGTRTPLWIDSAGNIRLPNLPSANPGAGSKCLWYDPADGNRVKFAA